MQDNEIIALYQQRSPQAVAEMQRKYAAYAHAIAYRIVGSAEDAQECVNDSYFKLWNSIPPQCPTVLSAFLGKIVRNLALTKYRSLSAQKRTTGQVALALSELEECIASPFCMENQAEEGEITQAINGFLRLQRRETRVIFLKRYWYLDSVEKIAADLNISQSKVKSCLFRTRNNLKTHLLKEGIAL